MRVCAYYSRWSAPPRWLGGGWEFGDHSVELVGDPTHVVSGCRWFTTLECQRISPYTTRIKALHDGLLWSQTVKNMSWLTYDDDREIRHVSHFIHLLNRLEPSHIGMYFRHEITGQQQQSNAIVMNWNVIKLVHVIFCHVICWCWMWRGCYLATSSLGLLWPIIHEAHLFCRFFAHVLCIFFI
jgi:hypothetical protein